MGRQWDQEVPDELFELPAELALAPVEDSDFVPPSEAPVLDEDGFAVAPPPFFFW